jgi:UDP-glucose 4-epimerase
MKRFFVTGGLGFIGVHLVRHLLEKYPASEITVFDKENYSERRKLLPTSNRISIVNGDICDEAAIEAAMLIAKPETVIHLAALHYIPYCTQHPEETRAVNVDGTANVISAVNRSSSCEVFALASSAAVYKDQPRPISENDPIEAQDIYGETKIASENLVHSNLSSTVKGRILRLFNVFGPNDPTPHVIPEVLNQLETGEAIKLGRTDTSRDFIHVKDVVAAIVATCDPMLGQNLVFNIGSGKATSIQAVIELSSQLLTERGQTLVASPINIDLERLRVTDREILCANSEKISHVTAWKAEISLETGLRQLVEERLPNPFPLPSSRPRNLQILKV